jgi:hypothetical protein
MSSVSIAVNGDTMVFSPALMEFVEQLKARTPHR